VIEHGRRPVDADQIHTGFRDGNGDSPRAAPELEDPAILRGRQTLPECDVTPRDGPRVLPVVERRVLVPAAPPLRYWL
jgi:hypothetical protein